MKRVVRLSCSHRRVCSRDDEDPHVKPLRSNSLILRSLLVLGVNSTSKTHGRGSAVHAMAVAHPPGGVRPEPGIRLIPDSDRLRWTLRESNPKELIPRLTLEVGSTRRAAMLSGSQGLRRRSSVVCGPETTQLSSRCPHASGGWPGTRRVPWPD